MNSSEKEAQFSLTDLNNLNSLFILLLILFVVQSIASFFRIYLFGIVTENSLKDIRENVFKKLIGQNIRFYDENKVGELQSRVSSDISLLTGGQKQRIAIARAILKNPPLLILDEATSALDNITENIVQDALNKLLKNRTSIIIAHRLSSIKDAENILVLESGEFTENGTHDFLIAQKGAYYQLYHSQKYSIEN